MTLISGGSIIRKMPQSLDQNLSKNWFYFLRDIEDFFISQGLSPAQTPTLVLCPGTEPYLDFFSTTLNKNNQKKIRYLTSSPEIHLKKILCKNKKDIFEIHKSYRNNEQGPLHLNEFHLLEWYRVRKPLDQLIEDLKNLLNFLKKKHQFSHSISPFQKKSLPHLFKKYCGMKLTPQTTSKDLAQTLKKLKIPHKASDSFEDLFHLLFLNKIEDHIKTESPLILYDYPPKMRVYSKLNARGFADRFEFYWKGVELANAFYEINDPKEQMTVFKDHLKIRTQKKSQKENIKIPIDQELIERMKQEMPPCSGIALGVERLFMVLFNLKDILIFDKERG